MAVSVIAPSVCINRMFGRLIRSSRAGVGKSLQKVNLQKKLRSSPHHGGKDLVIPFYKTVSADSLVKFLYKELGNGYRQASHNLIHIDIAHEVPRLI